MPYRTPTYKHCFRNRGTDRVAVEHGALPIFVQLLQSPNDNVRQRGMAQIAES